MIRFINFLTEASITDTTKLSHLDHAASLAMHPEHFDRAHTFLSQMHGMIQGNSKPPEGFTEKKDGGMSIVMFRHPESGKVGVGYKTSVFAKTPKLNYSADDIQRNHGTSPHVVDALNQALEHAPKILPKGNGKEAPFYQGDILFKRGDVKQGGGKVSYQPNVIKYTHDTSSPEGKLVKQSNFGIHIHTGYEDTGKGEWPHSLSANYSTNFSKLNHSPDVFVTTPGYHGNASYHEGEKEKVDGHLKRAKELSDALSPAEHSVIQSHYDHLNSYVNQTKREGSTPSHAGYIEHLNAKAQKDVNSVKTEKSKLAKKEKWGAIANEATKNKQTIETALNIQSHHQAATDVMTKALDRGLNRETEGYMGTVNGNALKAIHTSVTKRIANNAKFRPESKND